MLVSLPKELITVSSVVVVSNVIHENMSLH